MVGPKKAIPIQDILKKLDDDKGYFDKLYEELNHFAYSSQGRSSDIRLNLGKKNYIIGGTVYDEKAATLLRKIRTEIRKLNNYIECFFDNCD
jgi:hypothetical protein